MNLSMFPVNAKYFRRSFGSGGSKLRHKNERLLHNKKDKQPISIVKTDITALKILKCLSVILSACSWNKKIIMMFLLKATYLKPYWLIIYSQHAPTSLVC